MKVPDVFDDLPADPAVRRVYGEPHVTPDGATVIPVAKIQEGRGRLRRGPDADSGQPYGLAAVPIGVFVIHGADAKWVPAVDANRIALVGVLTGLFAAVIGSLAVLRRPPWPDITIRDCR